MTGQTRSYGSLPGTAVSCVVFSLLTLASVQYAGAAASAKAADAQSVRGRTPKALVVMLDGMRADAVENAHTPNIRMLRDGKWQKGYGCAWSLAANTILDAGTISGPNHVSIATGVTFAKHGVPGNVKNTCDFKKWPSCLSRIAAARPDLKTLFMYSWQWDESISPDERVKFVHGTDGANALAMQKILSASDAPDAVLWYIDRPDHGGHTYNFYPYSIGYMNAIHFSDNAIGGALNAIASRPTFDQEDWLVIITADHGGYWKTHGLMHGPATTIPLLVSKRGMPQGRLAGTPHNYDAAPTVLRHFGIDVTGMDLDGRAIEGKIENESPRELQDGLAVYLHFNKGAAENAVAGGPWASVLGGTTGFPLKGGFVGGCLSMTAGTNGTCGLVLKGSEKLAFENGSDFAAVAWVRMPGKQCGSPLVFGNKDWGKEGNPGIALAAARLLPTQFVKNMIPGMCFNTGLPDGGCNDLGLYDVEYGVWTFYAATRDRNGVLRFYQGGRDGYLYMMSENVGDAKTASGLPFCIGQDGTGRNPCGFTGDIDDFALWTRTLSHEDIRRIYTSGRHGIELGYLLKNDGGRVVQRPFETNRRHAVKPIMGREYWTFLHGSPYSDPGHRGGTSEKWWEVSPWANSSLTNLPVFRDCCVVRRADGLPPDPKGTKASLRTVEENCSPSAWKGLVCAAKKDRPFILSFGAKRNVLALAGEIDVDKADWAAFKAANPNLLCVETLSEWGNDILLGIARTDRILNKERHDALTSHWRRYALTNRYDRLALCQWYADRMLKLHYDDMDTFLALRGIFGIDHLAAAWGAKMVVLETTNTTSGDSEFRWDISGMFTRGAARQFGIPWGWYEANYFNGPGKDGKWRNNSVCKLQNPKGNAIPEGGTSASAQRRCWYYAYFNGANTIETESWSYQFFTTNTPSGRAELSNRGRNFSDFHDFAVAHPDRGVTYTPVAILTPFAQGYTACGGRAWRSCPYTSGDYAIDALFFTIAPGWERTKGLAAGIQEGNLHNSRFAMMYDVLTPDSPQPKEDFAKALFAYPAAILVGDYPDATKFEDVLAAYEKAGGRLVRISAADLPPLGDGTLDDILAGRARFPTVEEKLDVLQRDLFPFAVAGDCLFGANRTKNGWWLWVFNNKGVRKFADTFETIDHACDTEVSVRFTHAAPGTVKELLSSQPVAVSDGRFTFKLPAGELAVFEIAATSGK